MGNFRDFLNSKNYFEHLQDSIDNMDDEIEKLKNNIFEDDALDNLTDTDTIDSEVDKAQDDADASNSDNGSDEQEDAGGSENPEDQEPRDKKDEQIEKETFSNLLNSQYLKSLTRACNSFTRISNNKDYGFEIPSDKRSISVKHPKLVTCGYQMPFALFNASPINGKLDNVRSHLLDNVSVANISSDYYGVNFFIRNDFVITDTNTDNYAEKLFNSVIEELKTSNKLTYDFLKTAALNKIKDNQSIDDDVIIGYMRMYNFASYISKNIIEPHYKQNTLPVFVSDRENLDIGLIKRAAR